jgi:hypothetical protein
MATRQNSNRTTPPPSGLAVGITVSAAVILILAGVLHAMQGVVGLANNEFYVTTQNWIFKFDATTWGWVHILVGLIAIGTGIGLFYGAVWARTVGVIVAAVSVFANFVWLPYYPVWAILIIAFDFFVIWALTAHGRDINAINR